MKLQSEADQKQFKIQALDIFNAAISAVDPETCIKKQLRLDGNLLWAGESCFDLQSIGKIFVTGAGKASAFMAGAVEQILGNHIHDGVVITKYGHGVQLKHCRLLEAGHPIPDKKGIAATKALLDLIAGAGPRDLILCLISGGGSSLTPAPAEGISLEDKQKTTQLLLSCGATIHQINVIRKHLSVFKGGQFCKAANGARIVSLILSDVIGDDLDIISSGATAPDKSTFDDCIKILANYDLLTKVPKFVAQHLLNGRDGRVPETPDATDSVFKTVQNQVIGSISDALEAARKKAVLLGYNPLVLTSMLQGEAKEAAKVLWAVAGQVCRYDQPIVRPACLLSGGETTVTLKGNGKGGRNMEFALSFAVQMSGEKGVLLLSAGTDGTDGPTDAAGAFADGLTVERAAAAGISAVDCLLKHNSYPFFEKLSDLLVTGPTKTNVMDLQIVLIKN